MDRITFSSLDSLIAADSFIWAAGIEDTFITEPFPATNRTLDEYELTQHYERWAEDLDLFREVTVPVVRYGIPWHRVNPGPGQWDWSFPDASLNRLAELGIQPIVDLVHYGLPRWITGAYLAPDFPARMAEYATRVAERYRSIATCYTPLNEPRVTAWYCGKLGWWPPGLKGWKGFLRVLLAVCRGIVESTRALRAVDSNILPVHVDATDLYESPDPFLSEEVRLRQEIVFLALDLISGRLTPNHPLYRWALNKGATPEELLWFTENPVPIPLIGINLYPLFSRKTLSRSGGRLRLRMPYAGSDIIDRLCERYWERYRVPLLISETASEGSVARRAAWLRDSITAVGRVRARGIPLIGYTWWPLFALVTWAYRQGRHPVDFYVKQMGLWDLQSAPDGSLQRVPTALVHQYKERVTQGARGIPLIDAPDLEGVAHV